MNGNVSLHHTALQCENKEKAEFFYQRILCLDLVKTFTLSEDLTDEIFDVKRTIEVLVFQNKETCLEVFIMPYNNKKSCVHIGLLVDDITSFIDVCHSNNITYYSVLKGEKTLWFIKDFSDNIFEIKQRI